MAENKKIAVIGSNSFSGSDFADLLLGDADNQVIGISRSPEKSELFLPYLQKELGWAPKISIEEGLRGVIDWVDRFWDEIQKENLEYVHKA